MQWTTEQESVINHTAGDLLVAAAAGSGKTAVLVQHVISRIMDPVDPVKLSEMVIMTFTEAAAQEMRDRIKAALEEKLREHPDSAELIREAGSIQNASISTIDAFCKHFITENYAAIDLDPGFRMGDQGELRLLQGDILEDLLEEEYAAGEADFLHFVDSFAQGKTDAGIAELIQKLYESASSHPWPEEYLDGCLAAESADGKRFLLEQLAARLRDDAERMDYALSICAEPDGPESYLPNVAQEKQALQYAAAAEDLSELVLRTQAIRYDRLKPTKSALKTRVTAIRDEVKKDTKDIAGLPVVLDPEAEEKMEAGIECSLRGLVRLTKKFRVHYQEEKEKRHVLDFSDLEHKALEILYTTDAEGVRHPSAIAEDVAQQYREILVDEYQDSNFVQEELIRALSAARFGRPDVFQVGDVKQSIYSFRQARPDLFLMKYQDPDYPKIELSRNFRSRNEVVRAVNRVFHRVMRPMLGGIDYNEKVALHYGYPKAPESEDIDPRYQTELLLLEVSKETSEELFGAQMSKEEAEAHMIAERIQRLHADGVKYRDMVILLRSPGSWADTLVEILGADGVPAYCTSNEGYFDTVEVETVLALLDVIDNPQQDIPLAAVLHSPIYQFTDEELATLVAHFGSLQAALPQVPAANAADGTADGAADVSGGGAAEATLTPITNVTSGAFSKDEAVDSPSTENEAKPPLTPALQAKLDHFCADLARYRAMAHYLSIHELLYRIFDETGYDHYVSAMPAGRRRKANLDAMIDMALSFEKTSYKGLFDYIRYIEKLKKYDSDQGEATVFSDQDDLVRIMSIHKSKGLQFPVVFLSGMSRKFNTRSLNEAVLVDAELGIGCDYVDLENKVKIPSLKRAAIRKKLETDQLGEELRVLYVAMTRAEEKLILTATTGDIEKLLQKYPDADAPLSGATLESARCYLDWIMMAEGAEKLQRVGATRDVIELFDYTLHDIHLAAEQTALNRLRQAEKLQQAVAAVDPDTASYVEAMEDLSYHYPHAAATRLYPKHSVSEIKETAMEAFEEAHARAGREHWQLKVDHSETDPSGRTQEKPVHYQEKAGADVGDAYHHALEKYDYLDTSDFMAQLEKKLPEAEYKLVNPKRFQAFLQSPLAARFRKAQAADTLYREQHFMKQVPNDYLFPGSDTSEPVILQGIIDAFFIEDGEIVLVDYKSDHVREAETLIGRYQKQLELYAEALEKITGLRVKEKLIYSIILEQAIPV